MDEKPINPLRAHFRQPAIYIKLPSRGQFWINGLNLPENGELPVYPMTARDEIILRTPDALLNGQGIIDVIESCCPNITNAWSMPSVDVDALLIAIRIASYGNNMAFDTTCPHCRAEHQYETGLSGFLDSIQAPNYSKKLVHNNIQIKLKPQDYRSLNETNQIKYEEERLLNTLASPEVSEDVRVTEYKKHLERLVNLNAKVLVDNTEHIELVDTGSIVSEPEFISEFYFNCDADICKDLRKAIEEISRQGAIKPQTAECQSCSKSYEVPLMFDYSNFFAKSS
jgi:hypothetical protein